MKRMPALGRKLPHAGEVSSNPRPHQKTMHLDLSRLVGLSLLLRQKVEPLHGALIFVRCSGEGSCQALTRFELNLSFPL